MATIVDPEVVELRRENAELRRQLAEAQKYKPQLDECQKQVERLTARNKQLLQHQKQVETVIHAPPSRVGDRAKLVGLRQLEYIRKAQAKGEVAPDGAVLVPTWDICRDLGGVDRKSVARAVEELDAAHLWEKQQPRWEYAPWDKHRDGTPKDGAEKTQLTYVKPNADLIQNLHKLGTDPTTPVRNHGGPRTVSMRAPVPDACPECGGTEFQAELKLTCVTCGTVHVHDKKLIDTTQDEPEPEIEQDQDEEMVTPEPIEPEPMPEPAPEWYCTESETRHHEYAGLRNARGERLCLNCYEPERGEVGA